MKITFSLIIGISVLCVMFTACSNDDEVGTPPQQEQEFYHKIKVEVTNTNLRLFEATEIGINYTKPAKETDSYQSLSYDSIVWNIPDIFKKVSKNGYNLLYFTQSFHLPGKYQVSILGYKDGKVISGDSAKIDVKQSGDFLGQEWNNLDPDKLINYSNKEEGIKFSNCLKFIL